MCSFDCGWRLGARDFRAASNARIFFRSLLQALVTESSDIDAAETIFGELVGNALRYTGYEVRVDMRHIDDGFQIAVRDRGTGFDSSAVRQPSSEREGGRGVMIVWALGSNFEALRFDGGFKVSTDMPLHCRLSDMRLANC